jgi:hypothetical protein
MTHDEDELREKLAAIEHERWADWQDWMHQLLETVKTENGDIFRAIPNDLYQRWQRQIETPYSELSDKEKASDMEQVDRYWPLIKALLNEARLKAASDIFKLAHQYASEDKTMMGSEELRAYHYFNAIHKIGKFEGR